MDNDERNRIIAELIGQGLSLSDVQKALERDHGVRLTYMDLRLIASDLRVDWTKQESDKKAAAKIDDITKVPAAAAEGAGAGAAAGGRTTVTISKLVRPGALFSGDVRFKSGATADWALDQYGRLSLNPAEGSARPNEEDIREFQVELQRQLQGQL